MFTELTLVELCHVNESTSLKLVEIHYICEIMLTELCYINRNALFDINEIMFH